MDDEQYLVQYRFLAQPGRTLGSDKDPIDMEKRCGSKLAAQEFVDKRKDLPEFINIQIWKLATKEFLEKT